jgi:hypothetical protein
LTILNTIRLFIIQPIEIGGIAVGGIIVLGIVWEKVRPIIVIKTEKGVKFYFGISHSKKRKNLKNLSQTGLNGIIVDKDKRYGLCNIPSEIIKVIGSISIEKAEEIIAQTESKKIEKREKRTKK